ncbi:MAG: hypothetical protein V9G21_07600 [Methylotenera sp.]
MEMPRNMRNAVYQDSGVDKYRGNPLIEALPPIMNVSQIKDGLSGNIKFDPKDIFAESSRRVHIIAQLLDELFSANRQSSSTRN